jgi:hypothetical protein
MMSLKLHYVLTFTTLCGSAASHLPLTYSETDCNHTIPILRQCSLWCNILRYRTQNRCSVERYRNLVHMRSEYILAFYRSVLVFGR